MNITSLGPSQDKKGLKFRSIMVNIIVIAILIIPWLIIPINGIPEPTRLIKAAFFDFTMMGIIVTALLNGLKFEYRNKYLAYLSAWIFFTIACNWYYPLVRGIGFNAGTIDSCIHSILAIVATILVCSNFERSDFIRCAKAICISSTLISIFCIFQSIGLDPMKHIAGYRANESRHIAALLDHPDLVGNYVCVALPLLIYFGKPKYLISFGLCIICLFLTNSSLSIVAAVLGLSCYLLFKYINKKSVLISISSLLLIFIGFCFLNSNFNKLSKGFTGRLPAWEEMIKRSDNPLFGQGLGIVKSLQVRIGNEWWAFAHNDYLEVYCSMGALGLFLLILVIIHAFRRFNYKEDNQIGFAYYGCFIAFLITMCGSFPMEIPPLALNGLIAYWAVSKT